VLLEQQLSDPIALSSATVSAISRIRLKVNEDGHVYKRRPVLAIATTKPGYYQLQTNSIVGSFSAGEIDFNILPKAGVGKTAQLLAYSAGLAGWRAQEARFDDADTFVDAIVPMFIYEVERLVRSGLVGDYISVEELGLSPRGRIRFELVARQGISLPTEYAHDEFSLDTPLNRLLLRGLMTIREMSSVDSSTRAQVRKLLPDFADVEFEVQPHLLASHEPLPPRVAHYRSAAALATLIVQHSGMEPSSGSRISNGLLFDMNRVFEAFVVAVARRCTAEGMTVDVQGDFRALYLDKGRTQRIYPDFSLWTGADCQLVGDAKYKLLKNAEYPSRADLYQMVSYTTAARCSRALLIYVGAEKLQLLRIANALTDITIVTIDLEKPIAYNEERITQYLT
jgi:5-methylcytosine-specific restriction endonuclease McrBC regulatory subunit McrC